MYFLWCLYGFFFFSVFNIFPSNAFAQFLLFTFLVQSELNSKIFTINLFVWFGFSLSNFRCVFWLSVCMWCFIPKQIHNNKQIEEKGRWSIVEILTIKSKLMSILRGGTSQVVYKDMQIYIAIKGKGWGWKYTPSKRVQCDRDGYLHNKPRRIWNPLLIQISKLKIGHTLAWKFHFDKYRRRERERKIDRDRERGR